MSNYDKVEIAFKNLLKSIETLRELNVFTNKKDFTCQIGEWLVAILYDGERAKSGIQKHWDVEIKDKHIQVKSHAKAPTTTARWSSITYNTEADIDELVIVVFSHDYKLKEFYKIPWKVALPRIRQNKDRDVIYWNHLTDYRIEIDNLEKQDLIQLFR